MSDSWDSSLQLFDHWGHHLHLPIVLLDLNEDVLDDLRPVDDGLTHRLRAFDAKPPILLPAFS
jgi:hypothetical protein